MRHRQAIGNNVVILNINHDTARLAVLPPPLVSICLTDTGDIGWLLVPAIAPHGCGYPLAARPARRRRSTPTASNTSPSRSPPWFELQPQQAGELLPEKATEEDEENERARPVVSVRETWLAAVRGKTRAAVEAVATHGSSELEVRALGELNVRTGTTAAR